LNSIVHSDFDESQIFRIDHYLGKETVQNLLVFRFSNPIFEASWNRDRIDRVEITVAESLGVGERGGYYDRAGALRDMVQNHLLQLLSLVAMEPPTDLGADGVRDEKVKVFKSLRPWNTPELVAENVVRGQYVEGFINGNSVPGYCEEDRVNPESKTEAYVALRVMVDTWRWSGVPFYVRMGKRLPKKATEISIHFKEAPNVLFNATRGDQPGGNVLVMRIQPDEGISLRMISKLPGSSLRMEPVKMDFHYATSFGKSSPEAYERLLLDAMAGDATLFARRDEVEEAWRFVDHIEEAWHESDHPIAMAEYTAGSWGPKEAEALLERDGNSWRRL
jgi:glucose-6-phosphate 1-dehydrogenase